MNKINKNFRVSNNDIIEFNYWIKGKDIVPRLIQYFDSEKEYEDFMTEYQYPDKISVKKSFAKQNLLYEQWYGRGYNNYQAHKIDNDNVPNSALNDSIKAIKNALKGSNTKFIPQAIVAYKNGWNDAMNGKDKRYTEVTSVPKSFTKDYRSQVKKLFKKLDPTASEDKINQLTDFGLDLAANPQDLIDVLNEKLQYNKKTKKFSMVKVFSDWDQIRDLVKDQYPRYKFEKVRGSETDKDYKVRVDFNGKVKELTITKNPRKSALDNFQESTKMKVENTAIPKDFQPYQHKGYTLEQLTLVSKANDEKFEVRRRVAKNPNAPKEVLEKLANDEYWDVRNSVAKNPNAPKEVLEKLANDENKWVRESVATNPNAPKEILEKLAKDEDEMVRKRVTENPNTPKEALEKLANDKNQYVRADVAKNPNAPKEVLEKLANDENKDVHEKVAENPNTPKEILEKLANDKKYLIRGDVARNPNAPKEILEKLAKDKEEYVRRMVATNPNTPKEILNKLANDEYWIIREMVAEHPNYKNK